MSFEIDLRGRTFHDSGPKLLLAGPCVVESETHAMRMAERIKTITDRYQDTFLWVYKSSFDKANRSSSDAPRGPGMDEGLEILQRVKTRFDVPIITDIHESWQAKPAAQVADILQIPAFLCRQTDLLIAAAETGAIVNIKKGQFLAPHDMDKPVQKVRQAGNNNVTITERGTSFGYNNLIVDFAGFKTLRTFAPLIFDATHSTQLPGGLGKSSGGRREIAPDLARAAAAVGVNGFFMEVHDDPDHAMSDGPNQLTVEMFEKLLPSLIDIMSAAAPDARVRQ